MKEQCKHKIWEIIKNFVNLKSHAKENYSYLAKISPMNYDELPMLHLLIFYVPRILELQERWVDLLIEAEGALDGKGGMCLISCLFRSRKLQKFNFNCKRFKKLLNE